MLGASLRETASAVPSQFQLGFHPAHHHGFKLGATRGNGSGDALVVEQFQKSGKAFLIAVMRGRSQEQPVLEVRGKRANRDGSLRIRRVLASAGRGHVVRLVHDEQIVGPRKRRPVASRECFAKQARGPLALQEVDGRDEARKMRPRVHMDAASTTEIGEKIAIDNAKLESELVAHLLLPLHLDR